VRTFNVDKTKNMRMLNPEGNGQHSVCHSVQPECHIILHLYAYVYTSVVVTDFRHNIFNYDWMAKITITTITIAEILRQ